MSLTIKVPQNFNLKAIDRFLSNVVTSHFHPSDAIITIDFADLNHTDGVGITVLSNTVEWLMQFGVQVLFLNNDKVKRPGVEYLYECGFFDRYLGATRQTNWLWRRNSLPCSPVQYVGAHSWLEHRFTPWMAQTLCVPESALGTLRTCLKELFNNIGDHANVGSGFIHVQHYPARHSVGVTLSDFGVGIPSSMATRFPNLSDAAAIKHACEEGVTSKSRHTNMGIGLSHLSTAILANDGAVRIHSGTGFLHRWKDDKGRTCERVGNGTGRYPVTLIDLQLETRMFVGDDDIRENLEW